MIIGRSRQSCTNAYNHNSNNNNNDINNNYNNNNITTTNAGGGRELETEVGAGGKYNTFPRADGERLVNA